jgi:hypothetical protein
VRKWIDYFVLHLRVEPEVINRVHHIWRTRKTVARDIPGLLFSLSLPGRGRGEGRAMTKWLDRARILIAACSSAPL